MMTAIEEEVVEHCQMCLTMSLLADSRRHWQNAPLGHIYNKFAQHHLLLAGLALEEHEKALADAWLGNCNRFRR